jgi:hypothetical protein
MVPWLLRLRVDRQLAADVEQARVSWMRVASQHPGLGCCPEFPYEGLACAAAFNTPAAAVTDAVLPETVLP